jgi:PAS domain S-box-containing protein
MKFSRALRFTLISFAVCVLITVLVIFVQRNAIRTFEKNVPLARAGEIVKTKLTESARQLTLISGGDKTLSIDENVLVPLQFSQNLLQAGYDGTSSAIGHFYSIDDEDTKAVLKEAIIAVEQSLISAKEVQKQVQQNADAGAETAKFTTSIAHSLTAVDRLNTRLQSVVSEDKTQMKSLLWLTIFVMVAGFSLLIAGIYRTQRKSEVLVSDNRQKLETETKRVATLSQFIETVSSGNYDMELKAESDSDNLTTTLITMRDKLRQNADDDRRRNWATTGQAQIGEILRSTTTKASDLYDNIIRFLVKYTKSNQGGLFLLNDESEQERYLELVACYAFERKKFLTKRVDIGDGLVGQCFLEGQTVHLIEVPQDYISITSGLGGANPSSLLIVPMKVNDAIYGVIELASFKKYEPFEIELVEKLAESIASTISNVRVNDTTRTLLEKTQQQAEEMKSQEEEIRQNMEELEATQEEMRRKQTILERELDQSQRQAEALRVQEKRIMETSDTLQAIVDNIPRAIFWKDRDLRFQGCNKIFSDIAGAASPRELTGKTDFDMAWSAQADAYRKDDMEVMKSRISKLDIEEVNINSEGEESWVRTSKVPIITATGEVVAILGMFEDITALKRREADVAQKLKEREDALREIQELRGILAAQKV